jgi:protein-disulfide isomerase
MVLLGVMLSEKMVCKYCLVTHMANLTFLGVSSVAALGRGFRKPALAGAPALAGVLVLACTALAVADQRVKHEVQKTQQNDLDASLEEIMRASGVAPAAPAEAPAGAPGKTLPMPEPAMLLPLEGETGAGEQPAQGTGAPAAAPASQPEAESPKWFTGRYRIGPEKAGVRVVIFTDYQCPDCKRIEGQLEGILATSDNISMSVKHWPFCPDCNPTPNVPNMHPNACWAARAAETAGMLYGAEGFHKMHKWLFERSGLFRTQEELEVGLRACGMDPARFLPVMTGDEPLKAIRADIEEGNALGLMRTPMIFINGVELKGWAARPDAVTDAVTRLLAAKPEARTAENDHPPRAFAKAVADWREEKAMAWPRRAKPYGMGGDYAARSQVVLFGDFQEAGTATADAAIRAYITGRRDVRYEFRYYPVDRSCNPNIPSNLPLPIKDVAGCRAAKAAEAAGQLGGDAAYWGMHEWLMTHQTSFNDDAALRAEAQAVGLDPDAFIAKMNSPEVSQIIATDVDIGHRVGITEIPRISVNGKLIPRWKLPGGGVLETIIEEGTKPVAAPAQTVDPLKGIRMPVMPRPMVTPTPHK